MINQDEIKQKVEKAYKSIEDIKKTRVQYQDALRQLELNEAGWLGFIEALSPFLSESNENSNAEEHG
jgi:hypothetical protein